MPILALETSTDSLSVALSGGADCPAEGWVHQAAGGPEASRILIPAVLDLLERSGQRLQDLQAIAFGAGPGSFTGLRTACAVAQGLAFGAGLSDPNDPDLSLKDFTGHTRLWIEVGQPEDKPIAKAFQKADQVMVYAFHHAAEVWWRGIENKLSRLDKLQVWRVPTEASQALTRLAQRIPQLYSMKSTRSHSWFRSFSSLMSSLS